MIPPVPTSMPASRRVLAMIAALVVTGGGHLVLGRSLRGIAWFLTMLGCILAFVVGLHTKPVLALVFALAVFMCWLGSVIDALFLKGREPLPSPGIAFLVAVGLSFVNGAFGLAIPAFVAKAYQIPANSMLPSIVQGDQLIVSKLPFQPRRGDVVVFDYPEDPRKQYVKRVVGVAGDTIGIEEGTLVVNGVAQSSVFQEEITIVDGQSCYPARARRYRETIDGREHSNVFVAREPGEFAVQAVPDGHVFVLGDNRDNSADSRAIGPIHLRHVRGRALFTWMSWDSCESRMRWDRVGLEIE